MIIYGSNAKHLATETLNAKCPNCGTERSVQLEIYQRYAHIFWIPFFPLNKTGATSCSHCKQVLKLKEMPPEFKAAYEQSKGHYKSPLYLFSGVIIIALLIGIGMYSSGESAKKNKLMIQAPRKGDVYEVKADGQYTLYKVDKVAGDTVYILFSNYETKAPSGLSKIKAKGNEGYMQIAVPMLKSELISMQAKGDIMDIDR